MATLSVTKHLMIESSTVFAFGAKILPLMQKEAEHQLFSAAAEAEQMLFLNVSDMHHHKDTYAVFRSSVCVSGCWCGNTLLLSRGPPPTLCVAADSLSQPLNLLPACIIHTLTFLCWCLLSTWSL